MTTRQILFHHLKHHLFSVRHFIQSSLPTATKLHTIKTFGGSQFDMYCGTLTSEEILQEVLHYLRNNNFYNRETFEAWIRSNAGFQTIELSDNSSWTLRIQPATAAADGPFVHLHPSRHSYNTLRIKANAMKSIVVYFLLATDTTTLHLMELNTLREKHLGLSPIDPMGNTEELHKVFALLSAPTNISS